MFRYLVAILSMLLALSLTESQGLCAELSPEDVMAKVLLDKNAANDVKLANARVLLGSKAGCQQLVKLMDSQNNIEAKKLICDVLTTTTPDGLFVTNRGIPESFIEPLFKCLYSADQQLSDKAGLALAECFPNKVLSRLAGTAISDKFDLQHRLAAISAIENITGREALLNLAELLKDKSPEITKRVSLAICQRLMIDIKEFDPDYFIQVELPNIRWMSDVEYLMFQTRNLSRKNKHLNFESKSSQEQLLYWQKKYLLSETDRFNSLSPENKLLMLKDKLNPDQEYAVRQWAARQLVTWSNSANAREGEVASKLIKLVGDLIKDEQDYVRIAVAEVLGVLGNKSGTEPMIQQLLNQLDQEQSSQALRAVLTTLGQLQYPAALEQCLKVWENSKDNDVAAAAISAAGKITGKIEADDSARIKLLVDSITNNYSKASDSPVLRIAVFQAIKKIVEDVKWHNLAAQPFSTLISNGIADDLADVRSLAVYSQIALLKEQSPAKLIAAGLLDDPEAPVRFAVIEAIDTYGSASNLGVLIHRLEKEQSSDVKARLLEAMVNILNSMKVEEVYNWITSLKNGTEDIRLLKLQAISILSEKVSSLKSQTGSIDTKYEIAILEFSISDYLRKQQYEQAVQVMVDLLNSKIDDSKRVEVFDQIFTLIFNSDIELQKRYKAIDVLQATVHKIFIEHENFPAVFQDEYENISNDSLDNVLIKARIIRQFVLNSDAANVQQLSEFWQQQCTILTDIIAENIISDKLPLDQALVSLLKILDARFIELPETPEERIDFIKKIYTPVPTPVPAQ